MIRRPTGTKDQRTTLSAATTGPPELTRGLSKAELSIIPAKEEQTEERRKQRLVPRLLKSVLLPSHWIQNWGDAQKQLGILPSGKKVEMGPPEDPADHLEYPGQEGPFRWKDLVGTAQLVRQNIFFFS